MDFASSDAHEFLRKSWEVDAHLNEQKICNLAIFGFELSHSVSKNGQMVQKSPQISDKVEASIKGQTNI
jgi:hypothetical protein